MPAPFTQAAPYDITEIAGADNLYRCAGAIRALEEEFADAYQGTLPLRWQTSAMSAMLASWPK